MDESVMYSTEDARVMEQLVEEGLGNVFRNCGQGESWGVVSQVDSEH